MMRFMQAILLLFHIILMHPDKLESVLNGVSLFYLYYKYARFSKKNNSVFIILVLLSPLKELKSLYFPPEYSLCFFQRVLLLIILLIPLSYYLKCIFILLDCSYVKLLKKIFLKRVQIIKVQIMLFQIRTYILQ